MARKPQLTPDTLAALGVQRLARIVLDEAERVPAFRKRVVAALASTAGPDAVAKLIDRRLLALERARAMVGWEKERAFAEDLDATVRVITQELAPLSPIHAVQRLLRFVGGHDRVFERIDDSSGRIQDVYWRAAGAVPEIIAKILPRDLAQIPIC
ncbi:MAG: hypothetical protein KDE14_04460 [Rhodobacteraceae bacterium]|nr:hypothetical protein [Paracoccaceae bacterium]